MGRVSQNGYPACQNAPLGRYAVPHTNSHVVIRTGVTATCMLYVATRWHDEIEHYQYIGGYACRDIIGYSVMSNHASGTAIDINPSKHPLGSWPDGYLTTGMHRILNTHINGLRVGDVIRWGGDYSGRKDSMHFEINAGLGTVGRLAAAILHQTVPKPPPPKPPPVPIGVSDMPVIVSRTDEAEQYVSDSQTRRWIPDAAHRDLILKAWPGTVTLDIFTTESGMNAVAGPLVGPESPAKVARNK